MLSKPKAEADNTNRALNNSSYPRRTEFNNCFIIYLYTVYIGLRVNACIVNKNTQATKPSVFSRFWHKRHKLVSRQKVIYVFSIYDQITS